MKLDVNVLRYLSREDFRVLVAVEMGQKNVRRGWDALHSPLRLAPPPPPLTACRHLPPASSVTVPPASAPSCLAARNRSRHPH